LEVSLEEGGFEAVIEVLPNEKESSGIPTLSVETKLFPLNEASKKDVLQAAKNSQWVMDLSGKWSLDETLSMISSFSKSFVVDGVLGVVGNFPHRVLISSYLSSLEPIPCHFSMSGVCYSPPLVSPLATKLGM